MGSPDLASVILPLIIVSCPNILVKAIINRRVKKTFTKVLLAIR
jgi:hypothetical protein